MKKQLPWPDRFSERFHIFALGESFDVDAFLVKSPLRPDFVWKLMGNGPKNGVEFLLGDAETTKLPEQEEIAITYLKEHREALQELAQFPGVEAINLGLVYFVPLSATGFCVGPSNELMNHALDAGVSLRYYGTLPLRDDELEHLHGTGYAIE